MLRGAGAAGPKCAFVCSFAVGYDTIDIDECTRRNIVVTSGAGSITETTADVALFLLMGCTRHMGDALFAAKSGDADELAPLWFNRSATATANDPGQGDAQVLCTRCHLCLTSLIYLWVLGVTGLGSHRLRAHRAGALPQVPPRVRDGCHLL